MNSNILDSLLPQKKWKVIGEGTYGKVYKTAFLQLNEEKQTVYVAVKTIYKIKHDLDVKAELAAAKKLMKMEHPNIPHIFGYFESGKSLYLVMEFYPEGDLYNIFENFDGYNEGHVQSIVRQIVSALEILLEENMVHRDIKLDNILVKSWEPIQVALSDFNFSKIFFNEGYYTALKTSLGTVGFKAPEVYERNTSAPRIYARRSAEAFDYKCDVWSLGCVMYNLLSGGLLPFRLSPEDLKHEADTDFYSQKIEEIVTGDEFNVRFDPAPKWRRVSPQAKKLLRGTVHEGICVYGMLVKTVEFRCSYTDITSSDWMKIDFTDAPADGWPRLYDAEHDLTERERKQLLVGSAADF